MQNGTWGLLEVCTKSALFLDTSNQSRSWKYFITWISVKFQWFWRKGGTSKCTCQSGHKLLLQLIHFINKKWLLNWKHLLHNTYKLMWGTMLKQAFFIPKENMAGTSPVQDSFGMTRTIELYSVDSQNYVVLSVSYQKQAWLDWRQLSLLLVWQWQRI